MMRYFLWFLIFLSSAFPSPLPSAAPDVVPPDPVAILLRERFSTGPTPALELAGQVYPGAPELACFYQRRSFLPAWSSDRGPLPVADEFLAALGGAADEGLAPEDYRLAELQGLAEEVRRLPAATGRTALDLAFSDAFFAFAADLANGRLNPENPKRRQAVDADCASNPDGNAPGAILESALSTQRIRTALTRFEPTENSYRQLRQALLRYRDLARRGDPAPIAAAGASLQLGNRGERVIQLRQRLYSAAQAAGAELPLASPFPELFDEPLAQEVRQFQARNGFAEDGVVGAATLAELNRSAEDHVRQIEANLERWRWLPADLGARYVRVNIPAFRLDAVEDDRSVLTLRVIVGKPDTSTPTLSSSMKTIQLNPSWYVPKTILNGEILPKAAKDPTFLGRLGYVALSEARLRQKPGPSNALGRFKFVFPSRYGVYLHDTPSRTLFSREVRALSHGCVRVENPFDLAVWALRNDPQWTPEAIRARLDTGKEKQVRLPEAVPVHIGYWTAWAGDDGVLRFGRDVYKQDAELIRRLEGGKRNG